MKTIKITKQEDKEWRTVRERIPLACYADKHDEPCPLPCAACAEECDPKDARPPGPPEER